MSHVTCLPVKLMMALWGFLCVICGAGSGVMAQDSMRETPAVSIIRSIQDSVVPLFAFSDQGNYIGAGTGVFIDKSGFLLTAEHVVGDHRCFVLVNMKPHEAKLVGKVLERDLAILKVDLPVGASVGIELGRSSTAMLGEPIILGGNPGARGVVFSQGTINTLSIEPTWPNIFAKAIWAERTREIEIDRSRSTGGRIDFIQYDATTNRGNSGGPLVTYDRRIVGISSQGSSNEDGIYWAIPIDRIRLFLPFMLSSEAVGNFWTGVEVDLLSESGLIEAVEPDSPGWNAGLRSGDSLISVGGTPIKQAYEWYFRTWGRSPSETLHIVYERSGEQVKTELQLAKLPEVSIAKSAQHAEGLQLKVYDGAFPLLSSIEGQQSVYEGKVSKLDLASIVTNAGVKGPFAMECRGFLEIDEPGLYRMSIASDDGSKLYIHDKLLIDNDMAHPLQGLSRVVRLSKGLVPIRLEYSDLGGDKQLEFTMYRGDKSKTPLSMKYFHDDSSKAISE